MESVGFKKHTRQRHLLLREHVCMWLSMILRLRSTAWLLSVVWWSAPEQLWAATIDGSAPIGIRPAFHSACGRSTQASRKPNDLDLST